MQENEGLEGRFTGTVFFFLVGVGRSLAHRKKGSKKESKTKIVQQEQE